MTRKNTITPLLDDRYDLPPQILRRLKTPLALTKLGMVAERASRAFWPFMTILMLALAALALGLHEIFPIEVVWGGAAAAVGLGLWTFVRGVMRFKMPTRVEVIEKLDSTMPGRPIAALSDTQAIGMGDVSSEEVWQAHLARMADRAAQARAVEPDLNLTTRDPYALRYLALTAFIVALLFGSLWRATTVTDVVTSGSAGPDAALAAGPSWEGWIEPPYYTGMPSLYLNDIDQETLSVPMGSHITVRLYGEVGSLAVDESVSGVTEKAPEEDTDEMVRDFKVNQNGAVSIEGQGGREWEIIATPDMPPSIVVSEEVERSLRGEMKQPFSAADDYGVVAGWAEIELNDTAVERRYGLTADPEPREMLVLDLPVTISGDRTAFDEILVEDLSKHPWANLPVRMTLAVEDAAGQTGQSEVVELVLPGRRFFDPLAKAIIEQRRDLLWTRENLGHTVQMLRTITHKPEELFRDNGVYLQLRIALRRMEAALNAGGYTVADRDEMADVLWDIALKIEEGDLSDALEQLRRAQERLSEAMKDGASQEEIDQLMQELADAMQDYMRQLAQENNGENTQMSENAQTITGDQLRDMMNEIQRLMEEGRMAEAQALLQQLMEMMENMQITQGEGGPRTPGEQSMEDLSNTLRDQQDLSDEAFRNLQEQYNPGQQGQQGQQSQQQGNQQGQQEGQNQPGDQGQPGQQEGQGQQGQSQDGQQPSQEGRGQQQGQGQASNNGQRSGSGDSGGNVDAGTLADRQGALRRELERQRRNLPGPGTEEGDAARESLDRAGRAMDEAEEALRGRDLSRAIDKQAEALDALREGLRNLNESLAQNRQNPDEEPNEQQGQTLRDGQNSNDPRDPLGRKPGTAGTRIGTGEELLQGDDVYRRAEELLEEIRRRSGDQSRPEAEREYLERLLERF